MKANIGHLTINYKRADNHSSWLTGYWLCVYVSGSLITDVLNCLTLIIVSRLHLGQNSGKFSSTVLRHTLVRVLFLQIKQSTHFSFRKASPISLKNPIIDCAITDILGLSFIEHNSRVMCFYDTVQSNITASAMP